MKQQATLDTRRSGMDRWPGGTPPAYADGMLAGRQEILAQAFADAVLPRLRAARPVPARMETVQPGHVERLLALVLTGTRASALAHAVSLQADGLSVACLLLDVLTPVARQLGLMWDDDLCTFSDVTVGLGHLAHIMRELCDDAAALPSAPTALLVQMPGEQHGFGLSMVVHFFRQAGRRVRRAPLATSAELVRLVRTEWFSIVGVSVACNDRIDVLADDIRAMRQHARNPGMGVLVGGPPFLAHPQLAALVGADATAVDARQAVQEARRLVGMRAITQ